MTREPFPKRALYQCQHMRRDEVSFTSPSVTLFCQRQSFGRIQCLGMAGCPRNDFQPDIKVDPMDVVLLSEFKRNGEPVFLAMK